MYTIHVIPHTHWDREWYFTTSRSRIYLEYDFKKVLDKLEKSSEFTYLLDGQTSLNDDYIELRPQDKKRIVRFVKERRLFIGPWYTQTDQMLISDESIARNLYYGMDLADKFGGSMKIGYVPDSFGQGGNMPQVYKDVNINSCLFWRGVSDDEVKFTEFIWQGDDGTNIKAFQIPYGYYIGANIPEDINELKEFMNDFKDKIASRSSSGQLYFPNGFDQAPIRNNLEKLVQKMNEVIDDKIKISSIVEYVKRSSEFSSFEEKVRGELTTGKLMRIHKSIYSSRSDIKILNTKMQNLIVNELEPLLAISKMMGNMYPKKEIEKIWKLMFENAAHDSIGSCVSDNTNQDIKFRYKQVKELSESLMELNARLIATRNTDEKEQVLQVFNFLPKKRDDLIIAELYLADEHRKLTRNDREIPYIILQQEDQSDYVNAQTINLNPSRKIKTFDSIQKAKVAFYLEEINSMGFETIKLQKGDSSIKLENSSSLENEYIKVTINNDGSFNVLDKLNKLEYKNQGIIEENGDDGDSFNYSPPREDLKVRNNKKAEVQIQRSEVLDIASIKYKLKVPKNLEERKDKVTTCDLPVEVELKLAKNKKTIDISVKVDNNSYSHRLCMLFKADFLTKVNISDAIFGSVVRKNMDDKLEQWRINKSKWNEKPISINPLQSYVRIENENKSISVFPKGVREYEILDDDTISLTLFRTYSFMGKENLLYRPGRASGEKIIRTPDAELIGEIKTELSVNYGCDLNQCLIFAKEINTPIFSYQYGEFLNGRLIFSQEYINPDYKNSLESLCLKYNNIKLSAFKVAENYDGYLIRFVNNSLEEKQDVLELKELNNYKIFRSNILEEKLEEIDSDDKLNIKLKPNKFISYLLIKNE